MHKSQRVRQEAVLFEAAGVHLFFLPSYSPKLSDIEPLWNALKHHEMPQRSFSELHCLKRAVDEALRDKAVRLAAAQTRTNNSL